MIYYADVIVDVQYGDTGKGKITNKLVASREYDIVLRYNGGGNAGHTFYIDGKKVVTHQIPIGALYGITSIIGPGCVLNVAEFFEEALGIREMGFEDPLKYVLIDKRVHLVTYKHLEEDAADTRIGTTKKGIGPAYRDKYNRTGTRAESVIAEPSIGDYITDVYQLFFEDHTDYRILCEGAQGFHLDIDWGDYPYVTSSHCTAGSVCLNGIPPKKIRNIYGSMKSYETYVGNKKYFADEDPIFDRIREIGHEYGATTGRPRKIRWMNLNELFQAINVNGVTNLCINKTDVLDSVGVYKYHLDGEVHEFSYRADFVDSVSHMIWKKCPSIISIKFNDEV